MDKEILLRILVLVPVALIAITYHELMHAWVADKLGDPTARQLGRITFNPIHHIDLFGTIIIPILLQIYGNGVLFGYAKPVPVNVHNLRSPRRGMMLVAAAGPGANALLALVSTFLLFIINLVPASPITAFLLNPLRVLFAMSINFNVILMLFNLIPIPPLDGGRILVGLLPEQVGESLARAEPILMLGLIFLIMFDPTGTLNKILWPLMQGIVNFLLNLSGINL